MASSTCTPSYKTLKTLVFFCNYLAFLSGVIIIIVCVFAYLDNPLKEYTEPNYSKQNQINQVMYAGMAVGAVTILLGFLGCCGAISEHTSLLCLFSFILTILVLCQITVGSLMLAQRDYFANIVNHVMDNAKTTLTSTSEHGQQRDVCVWFQKLSHDDVCCFWDGNPGNTKYCPTTLGLIPQFDDCTNDTVGLSCPTAIINRLNEISVGAGAVLITVTILEVIAIVFAVLFCFYVAFNRKE